MRGSTIVPQSARSFLMRMTSGAARARGHAPADREHARRCGSGGTYPHRTDSILDSVLECFGSASGVRRAFDGAQTSLVSSVLPEHSPPSKSARETRPRHFATTTTTTKKTPPVGRRAGRTQARTHAMREIVAATSITRDIYVAPHTQVLHLSGRARRSAKGEAAPFLYRPSQNATANFRHARLDSIYPNFTRKFECKCGFST